MREVDAIGEFERLDKVHGQRSPTLYARSHAGKAEKAYSSDWLKYSIDITLASLALIVLAPMIIMVIGAMALTQGGPLFIAHRRIGKDGVMFPCFKFRTMVTNGDEVLARHLCAHPEVKAEWDATRKLKEDPRVTAFGRSLRKTSVDEIPQLFNVIRGEMSLVGPRPITKSEADLYGIHVHDYMAVRPGLTGLWQISGRSETTYKERVELDVRYVSEKSVWGDIKIMAMTVPAVMSSRGSY